MAVVLDNKLVASVTEVKRRLSQQPDIDNLTVVITEGPNPQRLGVVTYGPRERVFEVVEGYIAFPVSSKTVYFYTNASLIPVGWLLLSTNCSGFYLKDVVTMARQDQLSPVADSLCGKLEQVWSDVGYQLTEEGEIGEEDSENKKARYQEIIGAEESQLALSEVIVAALPSFPFPSLYYVKVDPRRAPQTGIRLFFFFITE